MNKYLCCLLAFCQMPAHAVFEPRPFGVQSISMSGISTVLSSDHSLFNNPSGLGFLKTSELCFTADNAFLVPTIKNNTAGFSFIIKNNGAAGIGVNYYGYSNYNEQKITLAYGRKFGNRFSAGTGFNYHRLNCPGYGNKNQFTISAGIQVLLNHQLTLGAFVFNPFRAKAAMYTDERIPTVMRTGLGYAPSSKVLICIEAENDLIHPAIFRTGIEYKATKDFVLRAGFQLNPAKISFGFGWTFKKMQIAISSSWHSVLGLSPAAGLNVSF